VTAAADWLEVYAETITERSPREPFRGRGFRTFTRRRALVVGRPWATRTKFTAAERPGCSCGVCNFVYAVRP